MEEEPGCVIDERQSIVSFKRSEDYLEEDADNPETRGFLFEGCRHKKACTFTESRLEIVDLNEGRIHYSFDVKQYFNDDSFKIECVTPLDAGQETPHNVQSQFSFPLLLVGCSHSTGGMVIVLSSNVDSVIRNIRIPNKVTAICPVTSDIILPKSRISLPTPLHLLSGLIAVGTQSGGIYLVELQRDTFLASYKSSEPFSFKVPLNLLVKTHADLNTQEKVETLMLDEDVHIGLLLNPISLHQDKFFIQLPHNKISTTPFHQADVYISQLHVIEEANILVVAYVVRRLAEVEGEVYVYKNVMQLWGLGGLDLLFTSGLWHACEITHLSHQIASDDPYASLYLHVACRTLDEDQPAPFIILYELRFETKAATERALKFESFLECRQKFEWYFSTEEFPHGRLVSLSTLQCPNDDLRIAVYLTSLYSFTTQSHHTILYLFDLNQWYSAQMPDEYVEGSSLRYTTHYDLTQILDSRSVPLSIEVYRSSETRSYTDKNHRIQFENYYYPNAYSFSSSCLFDSKVVPLSHLGVHEKALKLLTDPRSNCLLMPDRYFNLAMRLHLQPLYMEPLSVYHQHASYTQEEQRTYIMSLIFDLLDETFLVNSARESMDPSFLIAWSWEHITRGKQYVDKLVIPLFDFSDSGLDPRDEKLVNRFITQLSTILRLYKLLANENHLVADDSQLEQRIRTLHTLNCYYNTLTDLLFKKLLPECHSLDVWYRGDGIPYPCDVIRQYANQRRKELCDLTSNSQVTIPQHGLYMIDSLALHLTRGSTTSLAEQWGVGPLDRIVGPLCSKEGSSSAPDGGPVYPPPSLQALLRMYLLEDVPDHVKNMLLYYVMLDVQEFMPAARNKKEEAKLTHLTVYEFLNKKYRLMVRGVWCLDHDRLSEAYAHIQEASSVIRIPSWLHYSAILLFLLKRENQLAYQYTCDFSPECTTEDQVKIQLTTFLNMGRLEKALSLLNSSEFGSRLWSYFLDATRNMNLLSEVCALRSLSMSDEETLHNYLEAQRSRYADFLWLNFLCSGRRYCEAHDFQETIKRRLTSHMYSRNPSLQEPPNLEQLIWRTDQLVNYMYNKCVPQQVKEEYLSGKRTRNTLKAGKRPSEYSTLENSTKRGRYEFEFSFAPVSHSVSDDDDDLLGTTVNLSLLPTDPNISALLSTPYVHKKEERPPQELESIAPGSSQKPNKSLLKTPGSSSSVKKALSFASAETPPDEQQPTTGKSYSKALNFNSPLEETASAAKVSHSRTLNFSAEEEEDSQTMANLKHMSDPADEITVENENPMECEDDANSLISEDLSYDVHTSQREPIRRLSVIAEVSSDSSFQSADDSQDGFTDSTRTTTVVDIEPINDRHDCNTSKLSVGSDRRNLSKASDITNFSTASDVTNFSMSDALSASETSYGSAMSNRPCEEIRSFPELNDQRGKASLEALEKEEGENVDQGDEVSEESNKGESIENRDELEQSSLEIIAASKVSSSPQKKSLLETGVSPRRVSPRQHASTKIALTSPTRPRTRAQSNLTDETRSQPSLSEDTPRRMTRSRKSSVSSVESSGLESPSLRRSRRTSVSIESEKERPESRDTSDDRQSASISETLEPSDAKDVPQEVPKAKDLPSTPVRRSRQSASISETLEPSDAKVVPEEVPKAKDLPSTPVRRSRQSASISETLEPSDAKVVPQEVPKAKDLPSTPVRRSRRLSASQDVEQDNEDASIRRNLRSSSVTSLSSQDSEPKPEGRTPRMRKSVSSVDISSPSTRRTRRSSISSGVDDTTEPRRNLRSSSVSSVDSTDSTSVSTKPTPRKMSTRRSTSKLQPISEVDPPAILPEQGGEFLDCENKGSEPDHDENVGESEHRKESSESQPIVEAHREEVIENASSAVNTDSVESVTKESVSVVIVNTENVESVSTEEVVTNVEADFETEPFEPIMSKVKTICTPSSELEDFPNSDGQVMGRQELSIQTEAIQETFKQCSTPEDNESRDQLKETKPSYEEILKREYERAVEHIEVVKAEDPTTFDFEEEPMEVEEISEGVSSPGVEEVKPIPVNRVEEKPPIDTNQIKSILDSVNMADIMKIANAQKDLIAVPCKSEDLTHSTSVEKAIEPTATTSFKPSDSSSKPCDSSFKSAETYKSSVDMSSFFMPPSGFLFGTATSPPVAAANTSAEQITMSPTWNFSRHINKVENSSQPTGTSTEPAEEPTTGETVVSNMETVAPEVATLADATVEDTSSQAIHQNILSQDNLSEQMNLSLPLFKIAGVKSISNESFMRCGDDQSVNITSNVTFAESSFKGEEVTAQPEQTVAEASHLDLKAEANATIAEASVGKLDDTIDLDTSHAEDRRSNNTIQFDSSKETSVKEEADNSFEAEEEKSFEEGAEEKSFEEGAEEKSFEEGEEEKSFEEGEEEKSFEEGKEEKSFEEGAEEKSFEEGEEEKSFEEGEEEKSFEEGKEEKSFEEEVEEEKSFEEGEEEKSFEEGDEEKSFEKEVGSYEEDSSRSSYTNSSYSSSSRSRSLPERPDVKPHLKSKVEKHQSDSDSDIVIIDSDDEQKPSPKKFAELKGVAPRAGSAKEEQAKKSTKYQRETRYNSDTDSEDIEEEEDLTEEEEDEELSDEYDEDDDEQGTNVERRDDDNNEDYDEEDYNDFEEEDGEEQYDGDQQDEAVETMEEVNEEVEDEESEVEILSDDDATDQTVPESMRNATPQKEHAYASDGEANVSEMPVNFSRLEGYEAPSEEKDPLSLTRIGPYESLVRLDETVNRTESAVTFDETTNETESVVNETNTAVEEIDFIGEARKIEQSESVEKFNETGNKTDSIIYETNNAIEEMSNIIQEPNNSVLTSDSEKEPSHFGKILNASGYFIDEASVDAIISVDKTGNLNETRDEKQVDATTVDPSDEKIVNLVDSEEELVKEKASEFVEETAIVMEPQESFTNESLQSSHEIVNPVTTQPTGTMEDIDDCEDVEMEPVHNVIKPQSISLATTEEQVSKTVEVKEDHLKTQENQQDGLVATDPSHVDSSFDESVDNTSAVIEYGSPLKPESNSKSVGNETVTSLNSSSAQKDFTPTRNKSVGNVPNILPYLDKSKLLQTPVLCSPTLKNVSLAPNTPILNTSILSQSFGLASDPFKKGTDLDLTSTHTWNKTGVPETLTTSEACDENSSSALNIEEKKLPRRPSETPIEDVISLEDNRIFTSVEKFDSSIQFSDPMNCSAFEGKALKEWKDLEDEAAHSDSDVEMSFVDSVETSTVSECGSFLKLESTSKTINTSAVDEKSFEKSNTKKPEIRSPRKSLLLRKTLERSVFLPDSDSEFDETHTSKLRTDDEVSFSSVDQSLVSRESSVKGHLMSMNFKDQTVFLPYSDSESEMSFVDSTAEVYNARNYRDENNTIGEIDVPKIQTPNIDGKRSRCLLTPRQASETITKALSKPGEVIASVDIRDSKGTPQKVKEPAVEIAEKTPVNVLKPSVEIVEKMSVNVPVKVMRPPVESVEKTPFKVSKPAVETAEKTPVKVSKPEVETDEKTSVKVSKPEVETAEKTSVKVSKPEVETDEKTSVKVSKPEVETAEKTSVKVSKPEVETAEKMPVKVSKHEVETDEKTPVKVSKPKVETAGKTSVKVSKPEVETAEKTSVKVSKPEVETDEKTSVKVSKPEVETAEKTPAKVSKPEVETDEKTPVKVSKPDVETVEKMPVKVSKPEVETAEKMPVKVSKPEVETAEKTSVKVSKPEVETDEKAPVKVSKPEVETAEKMPVKVSKPEVETAEKKPVNISKPEVETAEKKPVNISKPEVETAEKKPVNISKPEVETAEKKPVNISKPEVETAEKKPVNISKPEVETAEKKPVNISKPEVETAEKMPVNISKPEVETAEKKPVNISKPEVETAEKKPVNISKPEVETDEKKPVNISKPEVETDEKKPVNISKPEVETDEKKPVNISKPEVETAEKKPVNISKPEVETDEKKPVNISKPEVETDEKKPVKISKPEVEITEKTPVKISKPEVEITEKTPVNTPETIHYSAEKSPLKLEKVQSVSICSDSIPMGSSESPEVGPKEKQATPTKQLVAKSETPRRRGRKSATPLVKEVLQKEATPAKGKTVDSTPAKTELVSDVEVIPTIAVTPVKLTTEKVLTPLRRSTRKTSLSTDSNTPVQTTVRHRRPSESSETSTKVESKDETSVKRFSLRRRTPSISSETSMVEEPADVAKTPVRRGRPPSRARTPSFDQEAKAKPTPVKTQTKTGKSLDKSCTEKSGMPKGKRASLPCPTTPLVNEPLAEEVVDFDEVNETQMLEPVFVKTPAVKKVGRRRTPSISSETSMVEERADVERTPVRRGRPPSRARTPIFDQETKVNLTPLETRTKTAKSEEKPLEESLTERSSIEKSATSKRKRASLPRTTTRSVNESLAEENSESDQDDKRSWQHERTHVAEFNVWSEEEEEEIDFDKVNETQMLEPVFVKTAEKVGKDALDEENARKLKRKSRVFNLKDKGTPTKRMKIRPSALAKIPEEKDSEPGEDKTTGHSSAEKESDQQAKDKSPCNAKESKKRGRTLQASKQDKVKEAAEKEKHSDEEEEVKEKEEPTGQTGDNKEANVENKASEEKPDKPLSRRASRALAIARLNARDSTASSTLSNTTRQSGSIYAQILRNAVAVGARTSQPRSSRITRAKVAEQSNDDEDDNQKSLPEPTPSTSGSARRGKNEVVKTWPLRNRGGSVEKEEAKETSGKASGKRGRDTESSPMPESVKKRAIRSNTRGASNVVEEEDTSEEPPVKVSKKSTRK